MVKRLFFLLGSFLFIFSNCPLKEGSFIEVPCKVVDMQGNPIQGVTLSLVNIPNDTTSNPKQLVETQKVTDSKGEATFGYDHSRLLRRFVRGEAKGRLSAIELFEMNGFSGTQVKPIIRYDSLVPIQIRLISSLPRMKNGQMEVFVLNGQVNNQPVLSRVFSISSTRIDTIFKTEVFNIPQFRISCQLNSQDTFRQKSLFIPQNARRDEVFTIEF